MIIRDKSSVDKLKARVEANRELRERQQQLDKAIKDREDEVNNAPLVKPTDFFCLPCKIDFHALGIKVVTGPSEAWNRPLRAVYRAKCPNCREECERRITDRLRDPYYEQSPIVQKMRSEHERDLIQPGDPRFNRLYGDPRKGFYVAQEEEERRNYSKKYF